MGAKIKTERDRQVLDALAQGACTASDLARVMQQTPSGVTVRLLRMQRDGLVKAIVCPVTGRNVGWEVVR